MAVVEDFGRDETTFRVGSGSVDIAVFSVADINLTNYLF